MSISVVAPLVAPLADAHPNKRALKSASLIFWY